MLTQDFLEKQAALQPGKEALVCAAGRFTYGHLDGMANRLAHALREQGIRRGDRVAIYLNNSLEAVVSIFAALKADAVFVVVNRGAKPEKVAAILNNCEALLLITDARALGQGFGEKLAANIPSLKAIVVTGNGKPAEGGSLVVKSYTSIQAKERADRPARRNIDLDLASLIYTSGTTGESKGVMCDHSNVVFVTETITNYLGIQREDVILNVLPLSCSYGQYQLMPCFNAGATLVLEESFAFPDLILERMARERVTGFAAVPTIYAMLLALDLKAHDLSALRYLTNAGAGLPVEHVKRLKQSFPGVDLFLMHGLTEVARTMFLPPAEVEARPGSSGLPLPGTELWLEDESGRRLEPGQTGELVIRGRHVMRGYWKAPELSRQRFRTDPATGDRLCYSDDLFRTDAEGYFYFVSRKDDIIKSRGEKVAPREVENVLCGLNGVQEAAVVGVPDPILGQAIKAVLVAPGATLTEADVIAHCKARLEYFMVPRVVEFRKELPKTASGKVRKIELS